MMGGGGRGGMARGEMAREGKGGRWLNGNGESRWGIFRFDDKKGGVNEGAYDTGGRGEGGASLGEEGRREGGDREIGAAGRVERALEGQNGDMRGRRGPRSGRGQRTAPPLHYRPTDLQTYRLLCC